MGLKICLGFHMTHLSAPTGPNAHKERPSQADHSKPTLYEREREKYQSLFEHYTTTGARLGSVHSNQQSGTLQFSSISSIRWALSIFPINTHRQTVHHLLLAYLSGAQKAFHNPSKTVAPQIIVVDRQMVGGLLGLKGRGGTLWDQGRTIEGRYGMTDGRLIQALKSLVYGKVTTSF